MSCFISFDSCTVSSRLIISWRFPSCREQSLLGFSIRPSTIQQRISRNKGTDKLISSNNTCSTSKTFLICGSYINQIYFSHSLPKSFLKTCTREPNGRVITCVSPISFSGASLVPYFFCSYVEVAKSTNALQRNTEEVQTATDLEVITRPFGSSIPPLAFLNLLSFSHSYDGRTPQLLEDIRAENTELKMTRETATLTFTHLALQHAGLYECRVEFFRSPTHTSLVNLTLVGKCTDLTFMLLSLLCHIPYLR